MSENETKRCPTCGMKIPVGEQFCPLCGCEVPETQDDIKGDICDNTKSSVSQDTTSENNTKEEKAKQNISGIKVCPQCGNECKSDDLFCNKCGCNLKQDKKCPNCGTPYADGTTFCGECGTRLNENAPAKEEIIRCTNCGTENTYNSYNQDKLFCKVCGRNLSNYILPSETKCKYCGSQISKGVKKCPHCGEWLEGGSGCGCGCSGLLVILCIIGAIFLSFVGESISLPLVGELTGGVIVILTICYFLPSLIAEARNCENHILIFLLDLFLTPTIIGWFLALIFAFTGRRRH